VALSPSLEVVVLALAILQAGGTYVPCDERLPWPRVLYMLTLSSAKLVIAGSKHLPCLIIKGKCRFLEKMQMCTCTNVPQRNHPVEKL